MAEDPKARCIGEYIAQALSDAMARGYVRIDMPWSMRTLDGQKVADDGMVFLRRNGDGSFTIRITDKYTGK